MGSEPLKAVLLAGGLGTRLAPYTMVFPKPLVPLGDIPIMEIVLRQLRWYGVETAYISVGHLAPLIEAYFMTRGPIQGMEISYLREDEPLGTAGALGLLPEPPTEAVLLMNGDLVTSADVGGLLDAHAASGASATIGVRRYVHAVPFGCVERDGDRVVRLDEKPTIEREVNSGIYALSPEAVARVERGVRLSMPELIEGLLDDGRPVGAFEIEDDWIDVGQREQLARARTGD